MKLWLGFGLGVAAGALLMHNCKWLCGALKDTQQRIMEKMEKKSEYDDPLISDEDSQN